MLQTDFGLPGWVLLLVIGLVAGWLASLIMRERSLGVIGYLIVGVAGSFLGEYIARKIGLGVPGLIPKLLAALAGALILVFLLRLIRRR